MKKPFTLLLFLLLLGSHSYAFSVAADTLKGQKRFVQHVSQTVCSKLNEEDKQHPISKLSTEASQALFERVLQASMEEHLDEMGAVMQANKVSRPRKFGEVVGRDVVLLLVQDCPVSQPLLASFGVAQLKNNLSVSPEEKPVLTLVSTEICQRMDAENSKTPLASRPAAERKQVMESTMQGAMLKHMEALSTHYGFKALSNKDQMEEVGRKIALLLVDQCPGYLLQLGVDEVLK